MYVERRAGDFIEKAPTMFMAMARNEGFAANIDFEASTEMPAEGCRDRSIICGNDYCNAEADRKEADPTTVITRLAEKCLSKIVAGGKRYALSPTRTSTRLAPTI